MSIQRRTVCDFCHDEIEQTLLEVDVPCDSGNKKGKHFYVKLTRVIETDKVSLDICKSCFKRIEIVDKNVTGKKNS